MEPKMSPKWDPKGDPKRSQTEAPKSSKTMCFLVFLLKRGARRAPKKGSTWIQNEPKIGARMGPKMGPRMGPKWVHFCYEMEPKWTKFHHFL